MYVCVCMYVCMFKKRFAIMDWHILKLYTTSKGIVSQETYWLFCIYVRIMVNMQTCVNSFMPNYA